MVDVSDDESGSEGSTKRKNPKVQIRYRCEKAESAPLTASERLVFKNLLVSAMRAPDQKKGKKVKKGSKASSSKTKTKESVHDFLELEL